MKRLIHFQFETSVHATRSAFSDPADSPGVRRTSPRSMFDPTGIYVPRLLHSKYFMYFVYFPIKDTEKVYPGVAVPPIVQRNWMFAPNDWFVLNPEPID